MKVLILDEHYRVPPLDGGSRALWDLQRSLTDLGHHATVTGDDSLLERHHWDVVMVSRPLLGARVAERAQRAATGHTVFVGHDLHHRRLSQPDGVLPGQPRPVGVMAALERRCWERYDLSIYPNDEEVALVRTAGADARWFPYFRIDSAASPEGEPRRVPSRSEADAQSPDPHWADAALPAPMALGPSAPLTLLFVGASSHAPNVTGLRWFADEVLPGLRGQPHGGPLQVQVVIVGQWDHHARAQMPAAGLHFTGPLSDAALATLRQRADATIAPLTAGAGLKSKVIEAMASGVPLIATSTAMAGIASPWEMALPGDDLTQWRASLRLIRSDPAEVAAITTRAGAYVHAHHGTEAYLAAVAALLPRGSA